MQTETEEQEIYFSNRARTADWFKFALLREAEVIVSVSSYPFHFLLRQYKSLKKNLLGTPFIFFVCEYPVTFTFLNSFGYT